MEKGTKAKMKMKKQMIAKRVGDAIESTGKAVSKAGKKSGDSIVRVGNKIEHSQDK